MAYWLLKTEPTEYSFADLEKDGKTSWTGVSNPVALKHMRAMKKGDLALVYHTGNEKAVVGIAEVISNPYPDRKRNDARLVVVDIRAKKKIPNPVILSTVKSRKEFSSFELVRMPRLSVMPVSAEIWKFFTEQMQRTSSNT